EVQGVSDRGNVWTGACPPARARSLRPAPTASDNGIAPHRGPPVGIVDVDEGWAPDRLPDPDFGANGAPSASYYAIASSMRAGVSSPARQPCSSRRPNA